MPQEHGITIQEPTVIKSVDELFNPTEMLKPHPEIDPKIMTSTAMEILEAPGAQKKKKPQEKHDEEPAKILSINAQEVFNKLKDAEDEKEKLDPTSQQQVDELLKDK